MTDHTSNSRLSKSQARRKYDCYRLNGQSETYSHLSGDEIQARLELSELVKK